MNRRRPALGHAGEERTGEEESPDKRGRCVRERGKGGKLESGPRLRRGRREASRQVGPAGHRHSEGGGDRAERESGDGPE